MRRSSDGPAPRGARSLLLTMLGEFVHPAGGSVWTSTVVEGLATTGITERNARQAIARLGDQGIAAAERHGRRTRWHLTDHGTRLLATGTERIYSFGHRADTWDESWLLVICSIPETQRAVRHRFRTQLTFEGFGFLSPSIAVSPHADREKAAADILDELGLAGSALMFRSASGAHTSDESVLRTAWDLESLAAGYTEFIERFDRDDLDDTDGRAAFGTTLQLVDDWRRFPFIDPELPSTLLPDEWVGTRAQHVFDERRTRGHCAAVDWFETLESRAEPS